QQTPLSGPMGPVDLAQSTGILIPQADKYIIGPGDLLTVRYSSPIQPPQQVDVVVDVTGAAIVPVTGRRVVVRGMRLDQFNKVMTTYIRQGLRDAQVESMFKQLRSISVNIIGESFAPGTYLMPSTVSLFNALYISGGPSENGSLRDIELRHADGTVRRYDMYQFLVYGRGNLDMDLQPGDAIYIPPAKTRVAVGGEVGRPAIYEMLPGEGLSTALRYAEGVKPTGVQKISIISVRPGQEHVIIDASAAANQRLYNGDSVEVYSVRSEVMNEVSIEGAVLTPRQYAISKGMRVADLVAGARGLRREAYVDRADLFRKNPDGTFKLISINLSAAIKGDPTQNVLLMPFDRLHVYTVDEVMSLGTRKVTSQGAVRFPATLYRADNMTVRDVILQSGGLALNAYQSLAYLQRMNPDGTPGPLLKVNLIKALQGDPRENILVQDQDILRVMTVQEQAYIPDQVVTITGAVQRPGNLTLHQGMTIRDMLGEAGGPLDNAYLPQAFLQRRNPDGTVGPIITIDVAKAMAGDPGNNIPLQPFDTFAVYNLDQARFKVPEFVRLEGGVQRPGMYQSSPNMTLKDAIVLAGGPLPTIGDEIQLQHAYQPRGEKPIVLKASDWQGETGKYHLQAGDTITIPERNDLIDKPGVVFLTGDVSKPGPYVLTGDKDKDRLSTIIKQAGGLTKDAFPEGAQITRDPKLLQNDTQRNLAPRIANVFSQMEAQEYERARALVASDRLGLIFKNGGSNINPGGSSVPIPVPSGTSFLPNQPTTPLNVSGNNTFDMALAQLLMTNGASPARTIDVASLTPVGAMPARLDVAMAHIRSEADITLKEGDIIYVPDRPTTIVVSGSVVAPKPMPFERNGSLGYYIQRAGGTTQDADMREAIVIRASGQVMRVNSHSEIKAGDVIFIPSKVLINRLQTNNIDLTGFASSVGTALTTAVLLKLIIG
ncbi:MAG TPA: SLBB domain-containing protein, partial [Fimbriimonas sp.]|nr:SLBB domain-containing protein [Fimbriimonas sp.]